MRKQRNDKHEQSMEDKVNKIIATMKKQNNESQKVNTTVTAFRSVQQK